MLTIVTTLTKSLRKMGLRIQIVACWDSWKNNLRTRGMSVWTQIKFVLNGKNIKRKPLINSSQFTFILTLKIIISIKKWGPKVKIWSPCADERNTFGMHDTSPRVQLIPDCRDEHIKLKLLASPSRWTYALAAFFLFSSKKSGLQRRPKYREQKMLWDARCEPSSPNQVHL